MSSNVSILDLKPSPHLDVQSAPYLLDLNLNQIIAKINLLWEYSDVSKFFQYFPLDEECEAYRRQIYQDVKKPAVYEGLLEVMGLLQEMQEAKSKKAQDLSPLQKSVWHIHHGKLYCDVIQKLGQVLGDGSLSSDGLRNVSDYIKSYLETPAFREMNQELNAVLNALSSYRFTLTYENNRVTLSEPVENREADYETFLDENISKARGDLRSPFLAKPQISDFENEYLEVLYKKDSQFFKSIGKIEKTYASFEDEAIMNFLSEITFYLSYRKYQLLMEDRNFHFCMPNTDEEQSMSASGLYDLALATVTMYENRPVVSNDFFYDKGESFFVLTGPNQGGKTTFARSLGQLVYLTKMGLDVPASHANVHYFKTILTHFSVEESVETGRGKLKEELVRLAPMMDGSKSKCFVIINELFTTAATYDAEIMGKKVLNYFINQDCFGIYVTHLWELTKAHEKVCSLSAMLDENNKQSFKIARKQATETACAFQQVNKYHLNYDELKERLKKN